MNPKNTFTRDLGRSAGEWKPPRKALAAVGGGRGGFLALGLLKAQGVEIKAIHLRIRNFPEVGFRATPPEVTEEVCKKLQIPLETIDVSDRFEAQVVDPVVHAALRGMEPEPYRAWTREILFPMLFEHADRAGCETVVTGHFAQAVHDVSSGQYLLQPAVDQSLDQSDFLATLDVERQLSRVVTPLGSLGGLMLERLAREISLPPTADRSLESRSFAEEPWRGDRSWIERRVAPSLRPRGVIRSVKGELFGEHDGVFRLAYGQSVLNEGVALPEGWAVLGFDESRTSVIVGPRQDLLRQRVRLRDVRWMRAIDGLREFRCEIKLGPSHFAPARVLPFEVGRASLECAEGMEQAFPGRTLVFYEGGEVLGSGRVEY